MATTPLDLTKSQKDAGVRVERTRDQSGNAVYGDFGQITSSDLQPAPSVRIQDQTYPSQSDALQGQMETFATQQGDAFAQQLALNTQSREADVSSSLEELLGIKSDIKGTNELTAGAEEKVGLAGIDTELQDINNQILQEQQGLRRQIESIQTGAGTATKAQRDAASSEAQRVSLRKQADLAIVQLAAQGKYDSAKAIADRSVAIQTERDRQRLDTAMFQYQEYKDLFSTADQRQFQVQLADRQRELDRQEEDARLIQGWGLEASVAGAPPSVVSSILSADSIEDALKSAGSYLGVEQRLSIQKARLEIDKLNKELSGFDEVNVDGLYAPGTQENTLAWIKKSGEYDKEIDASQVESIEQIQRTLGSMESLNTYLFGVADEDTEGDIKGDLKDLQTGRISGRVLTLKTALKEGKDAKAIQAIITGMLPTVARGIFGEVGVLTDTDIERYKGTLARFENTPDENRVIQLVMLDTLSNSYGAKLETLARSRRNVSGFEGQYIQTQTRVENIKLQMGVTGLEGVSDDELFGGGKTTADSTDSGYWSQFPSFQLNP